MRNVISMGGIKLHLHRSFAIWAFIICFLLVFILFSSKNSSSIEKIEINNDEDINLVDLFNNAFELTYQAGQAIKIIKNSKKQFKGILQKQSFKSLQSEPVTIADFISHSIITHGLKDKFKNLEVFQEFCLLKILMH